MSCGAAQTPTFGWRRGWAAPGPVPRRLAWGPWARLRGRLRAAPRPTSSGRAPTAISGKRARGALAVTLLITAGQLSGWWTSPSLGAARLAGSQSVMLNAPNIAQDKPLDCEAASLQLALAVAGFGVSQDTIFHNMPQDPRRAV